MSTPASPLGPPDPNRMRLVAPNIRQEFERRQEMERQEREKAERQKQKSQSRKKSKSNTFIDSSGQEQFIVKPTYDDPTGERENVSLSDINPEWLRSGDERAQNIIAGIKAQQDKELFEPGRDNPLNIFNLAKQGIQDTRFVRDDLGLIKEDGMTYKIPGISGWVAPGRDLSPKQQRQYNEKYIPQDQPEGLSAEQQRAEIIKQVVKQADAADAKGFGYVIPYDKEGNIISDRVTAQLYDTPLNTKQQYALFKAKQIVDSYNNRTSSVFSLTDSDIQTLKEIGVDNVEEIKALEGQKAPINYQYKINIGGGIETGPDQGVGYIGQRVGLRPLAIEEAGAYGAVSPLLAVTQLRTRPTALIKSVDSSSGNLLTDIGTGLQIGAENIVYPVVDAFYGLKQTFFREVPRTISSGQGQLYSNIPKPFDYRSGDIESDIVSLGARAGYQMVTTGKTDVKYSDFEQVGKNIITNPGVALGAGALSLALWFGPQAVSKVPKIVSIASKGIKALPSAAETAIILEASARTGIGRVAGQTGIRAFDAAQTGINKTLSNIDTTLIKELRRINNVARTEVRYATRDAGLAFSQNIVQPIKVGAAQTYDIARYVGSLAKADVVSNINTIRRSVGSAIPPEVLRTIQFFPDAMREYVGGPLRAAGRAAREFGMNARMLPYYAFSPVVRSVQSRVNELQYLRYVAGDLGTWWYARNVEPLQYIARRPNQLINYRPIIEGGKRIVAAPQAFGYYVKRGALEIGRDISADFNIMRGDIADAIKLVKIDIEKNITTPLKIQFELEKLEASILGARIASPFLSIFRAEANEAKLLGQLIAQPFVKEARGLRTSYDLNKWMIQQRKLASKQPRSVFQTRGFVSTDIEYPTASIVKPIVKTDIKPIVPSPAATTESGTSAGTGILSNIALKAMKGFQGIDYDYNIITYPPGTNEFMKNWTSSFTGSKEGTTSIDKLDSAITEKLDLSNTTKSIDKSLEKINLKSSQRLNIDITPRFDTLDKALEMTKPASVSIQRSLLTFKTDIGQTTRQKQDELLGRVPRLLTRLDQQLIKPKIPKVPRIPLLGFGLNTAATETKSAKAHKLEIKKQGKFEEVASGLSRAQAHKRGQNIVDNTAARTYRTTVTDQLIDVAKNEKTYISKKFRPQIKGGRPRKNEPGKQEVYVEKAKYAIDSDGEKSQITNVGIDLNIARGRRRGQKSGFFKYGF